MPDVLYEKVCVVCGATFSRPRGIGNGQWTGRKCCSVPCASTIGVARAAEANRKPDSERPPTYRNGYRMWWESRRGRFIYEHRVVMEAHLGRDLLSSELVHHKNHDKLDNRLENLEVMSRPEHQSLHTLGKPNYKGRKPRGRQVPPQVCEWCGAEGWWNPHRRCCSRSCGQKLRYAA